MESLSTNDVFFAFSPEQPPALYIRPGTTVEFHAPDCFNGEIRSEADQVTKIDLNRANPACGPVFVQGAEPGDTLIVDVLDISVDSKGITALFPQIGLLRQRVSAPRTKFVAVERDRIFFEDELEIPLKPQIGVIGTSPATGYISTVDVGENGSNLDCPEITAGVKVYLPVAVPGGLLGIGDLHASQGAGEICGTGVEVEGRVRASIDILKGVRFPLPMVETSDSWYVLCPDLDFGVASRKASSLLFDLITENWKLSPEDAFMLMSITADVGICACFEPGTRKIVVKVRMPKLEDLPTLVGDIKPFNIK